AAAPDHGAGLHGGRPPSRLSRRRSHGPVLGRERAVRGGGYPWASRRAWEARVAALRAACEDCAIGRVQSLFQKGPAISWSPGFSRSSAEHRLKPGLQRRRPSLRELTLIPNAQLLGAYTP